MDPTEEAVCKLAAALIEGYEYTRHELADRGRALPGARETLAALADGRAIYQTLLTGNLRDVARIKLEVFELDGFLDLESGAYGGDHARTSGVGGD